jgi:hypothetical protein
VEPEVYRRAREFRSQLLAGEESARLAILEAYSWSYSAINQAIENLIRFLIERGEPITASQLERLDRWQELLVQVEREARAFGQAVALHVSQAQRFQIAQARTQAIELMRIARPLASAFAALPTGAIEQLVGFLQDGNPIATAIEQAFPALMERVKREMVVGLARGQGPKVIARKVAATMEPPAGKKGQGSGPLASALRIARTEILRAHREASRETYQQNTDVVQGWIWLSSRGVNTCAACLAMDGTTHQLSQPMGSHPNCRCVCLPWLIGDPKPTDTGQAWLEKQSESVQAQVLGRVNPDRDAAKAFRSGRVRLADFVNERNSDVWGTTRTARSLDQALVSAGT